MSTDPKKTDLPKTDAPKTGFDPFAAFDPMAYWTASQQAFQRAMTDAYGRAQTFAEQYAALEATAVQRAQGAVASWAQLTQDAIAYAAQLSAEARKLGFEAARKMSAGSLSMDELYGLARAIANAWLDAAGLRPAVPPLAQTPRDELALEGGARLLHFRGPPAPTPTRAPPILLVPSLINRWYVLDLRPGASLVEALVGAGFDVWLLDWGVPEAEDRYLDWDAVLRRLGRATRRVLRDAGAERLAVLGYCMGGTLSAIHAAQHPDTLAAFITLAAPIDFAHGGMLRRMVDPAWFDPDAIADAGNVAPSQMQAGFAALRPTLDAAKLASMPELATDDKARSAFLALEEWATDNIPFPGAAYRRYIAELYQANQLVAGTHRANGKPAALGAIRCPTLVITAARDAICPPAAATALLSHVGTKDTSHLEVPGGHVGAVVGSRASRDMYPGLIRWLTPRLT